MVSQREHIDTVAKRTGLPVTQVAAVIREHLRQVTETLAEGENVVLTGFGTFRPTERGAAFKPGATLRKALSGDDESPAVKK